MAYIDNTQTKREIDDAIRGNSVSNVAPGQVSNDVQLVCDVNPKNYRKINVVKSGQASNSTATTLYTTPIDKDFFLTNAAISVNKDITATSIESAIVLTLEDGTSTSILNIGGITLTPQSQCMSISFNNAVKLKRNSTIVIINSSNVANILTKVNIMGYISDN